MPGQNAFFSEQDNTLDPLVHIHEAADPQGRGVAAHTDGAQGGAVAARATGGQAGVVSCACAQGTRRRRRNENILIVLLLKW